MDGPAAGCHHTGVAGDAAVCGRYAFNSDAHGAASLFGLVEIPEFLTPRYNVAPRQLVPVVAARADGVTRKMGQLSWGLLPYWANDAQANRPINARAETVHTAGTFRRAFEKQRCLIPASGFFEWQTEGKVKRPHYFRMKDGRPFAFAGLWEAWTDGSTKILTCCSITTDPNAVVGRVHDRMPVIVAPEHYTDWLAAATPPARLRELLRPFPADAMEGYEVSSYVSKATNEGEKCIQPIESEMAA